MPLVQLPKVEIQSIAAVVDTDRLVVINRDPGPGETGVPLSWPISLEIVDTGLDGVNAEATRVWVNGVLAFDGAIQPGFAGEGSEVSQTADTLRIVLVPRAPFASEEKVTVRIVSATIGGAATLDQTYHFTIEDRTAPRATSAFATGQKTVVVGFDELVEVSDLGGFFFKAIDKPAVPLRALSAIANGNIVELQLDTEMTPDVRYRLNISGVVDTNNNSILPPYDTVTFTGFRSPRPLGRHFQLWELLPKYNRRIDETGDLRNWIACLQEITDLLLFDVDRFGEIFDLERAPEKFLDLILQDLGNPFDFNLTEIEKRRLASVLMEIYQQKGTAVGIKNAIRFFLGLEIEILPFTADVMRLGESRLGLDWVLGPSDRFARYAFDVEVDRVLTDSQEEQLRGIVNYMRPAHTRFVRLVEPAPPVTEKNWILGVSKLGVDSELSISF